MDAEQNIVIRPLTADLLEGAIRIHEANLGHTVNSRLGTGHLRFLYETMSGDPNSCVIAALIDKRLVGVVSGTLDAGELKRRLVRAMSGSRAALLAVGLAVRPWLLFQLWQSSIVAGPVHVGGHTVAAILAAIAVEANQQGRGIGTRLVEAYERFLAGRHVRYYRLDTLADNRAANRFYRRLGFQEFENRAGSTIFVKELRA
jgi:ribosomal protein S18 acetylase RimI-like enzyme